MLKNLIYFNIFEMIEKSKGETENYDLLWEYLIYCIIMILYSFVITLIYFLNLRFQFLFVFFDLKKSE